MVSESDIINHKFILICGDNINSLSILRSLGEEGLVPYVLLLKENHIRLLSNSRYKKHIIYTEDFEDAYNKLHALFGTEEYKPFVLTTDDCHQHVLDSHYDELKDHFYLFNCGRQGALYENLDKAVICKKAEDCGLKSPRGEVLRPGEMPQKLHYPVFTKTIDSVSPGWKQDVYICKNADELKDAYVRMSSPRLLVQEYIEKKGELSMQGISINGGEDIYIPFERMYLRYTRTTFGGYMYYQLFKNEILKKKIKKLIKNINYTGCFEVEFLVDKEDNLYFLEVNLRFSASNYAVNFGGVNQAVVWAKSMLSGRIEIDSKKVKKGRFYAMNEVIDFRSAQNVGYAKWIWQLITADSHYWCNYRDPKPLLSYITQKIYRKMRKKMRK